MASTKRAARAEHWQRIVDRFNASGLSVGEFCARYHISAQSLYQWRRKLKRDHSSVGQASAVPDLIPVRIVPAEASSLRQCSPTVGQQVQIDTPSGFVLRVNASIQPSQLAELLTAVESIFNRGGESC